MKLGGITELHLGPYVLRASDLSTGQFLLVSSTTITSGQPTITSVEGATGLLAQAQAPVVGSLSTQACAGNDGRLSDARTPLSHGHAQADITNLVSALAGKAATSHSHISTDITGTAVLTNDARLSDARTPLSHGHVAADISGTAVLTNDARLSDARTPLSHAATSHSFPGGTTTFLRADGSFASPTASVVDPNPQAYAPGSFTVADGRYVILCKRLTLTGSQRVTLQGNSRLRIL